jgi:hypothetical protein
MVKSLLSITNTIYRWFDIRWLWQGDFYYGVEKYGTKGGRSTSLEVCGRWVG